VDGTEDLGERLVEVAPDITRHERRDPKMQYTVYAPPGSLMRGVTGGTTQAPALRLRRSAAATDDRCCRSWSRTALSPNNRRRRCQRA